MVVLNLLKSNLRKLFQFGARAILFRLQFKEEARTIRFLGHQLNIVSAVTGFAVGGDTLVIAEDGTQTEHKAMIEDFLGSIMEADRFTQ